jgi:hypothetical protein
MMAPQFETARMLSAAIDRAIAELADPIERNRGGIKQRFRVGRYEAPYDELQLRE